MRSMFSSLTIPNYRRYFIGCLSGNIGTWMSVTAKSWLVLVELTKGSAITLGWLTTVMFLPQFLFQPLGGIVADRFPKRRIAMITQTLLCASATALSVLVVTGHIQLWQVFALAFFDGTVGAFDGPARQAFVAELVPGNLLTNAIALNSSSWNAARLFGPAVGGGLIALFGTGHAFSVNAASFLVLIFMLWRMNPSEFYIFRSPAHVQPKRGGLMDGVRYILDRPQLTLLFFTAFMMGTFGFNYSITNTLMATAVFHKGAGEYGMLGSIMGIGSLTGALLAARREKPRIRFVFVFLGGFALSLVLSALSPHFWIFAAVMIPIGLCSVSVMVVTNSVIQMDLPPNLRGRVMALWGIATLGLTPAVSPALGWVGDQFGARATVWVGAVAILVTFLYMAWNLFGKQHIRIHHLKGFHFGVEYPNAG